MRRFAFFWLVCSAFFLVGEVLTFLGGQLSQAIQLHYLRYSSVPVDVYIHTRPLIDVAWSAIGPSLRLSTFCAVAATFWSFQIAPHHWPQVRGKMAEFGSRAIFVLCLGHTLALLVRDGISYFFLMRRYHAYSPEMHFFQISAFLPYLATAGALYYLFRNAYKKSAI